MWIEIKDVPLRAGVRMIGISREWVFSPTLRGFDFGFAAA